MFLFCNSVKRIYALLKVLGLTEDNDEFVFLIEAPVLDP